MQLYMYKQLQYSTVKPTLASSCGVRKRIYTVFLVDWQSLVVWVHLYTAGDNLKCIKVRAGLMTTYPQRHISTKTHHHKDTSPLAYEVQEKDGFLLPRSCPPWVSVTTGSESALESAWHCMVIWSIIKPINGRVGHFVFISLKIKMAASVRRSRRWIRIKNLNSYRTFSGNDLWVGL